MNSEHKLCESAVYTNKTRSPCWE